MDNTNYTNSTISTKPFTMEDLKKLALTTYKRPSLMDLPEKKKSIVERIMNKFGWYRQYEVIVLNSEYIEKHNFYMRRPVEKFKEV